MSVAFAFGFLVSLLTPEHDAQARFEGEKLRVYLASARSDRRRPLELTLELGRCRAGRPPMGAGTGRSSPRAMDVP